MKEMQAKIKLIAVDMDGTFLDDQMNYQRSVFRKIYEYFKKNDIHFVVASGNQYYQLKSFFDDFQDELTYISENGALIIEKQQEIFHNEIPCQDVEMIVQRLQKDKRIGICLCGMKSAYILNGSTEFYHCYSKYYYRLEMIESLQEIDDTILKIALMVPEDETDDILQELIKDLSHVIEPVSSGHGSIDLIVSGFNKATAIEFLCERYHISLDECAAFGDGGNDIEMIQKVKYGFAMKNGSQAIKDIADYIVPSNNEHGVIQTLLEIFDIPTVSEREKSLLGMWYDPNHNPQVVEDRLNTHHLCYLYNQTDPLELEKRQSILEEIFQSQVNNLEIVPPFLCDCGPYIQFGKNIFVNSHAYFMDGAQITIGDNVFIGPSVGLYTAIHPLNYKKRNAGYEKAKPITIGDNVWLGANVIVLPGVTIGSGSVIGAGSVVNKDIPENVVAFGNPCRVVKTIEQND